MHSLMLSAPLKAHTKYSSEMISKRIRFEQLLKNGVGFIINLGSIATSSGGRSFHKSA